MPVCFYGKTYALGVQFRLKRWGIQQVTRKNQNRRLTDKKNDIKISVKLQNSSYNLMHKKIRCKWRVASSASWGCIAISCIDTAITSFLQWNSWLFRVTRSWHNNLCDFFLSSSSIFLTKMQSYFKIDHWSSLWHKSHIF